MYYESFFTGAGTMLLGTLIGAWIAPRLMYPVQKKLLDLQLEFQAKQADKDAALRKEISVQHQKAIEALDNTVAHPPFLSS
jgi:hypothetical protein